MTVRLLLGRVANKGSRAIDSSFSVLFWSPVIVGLYLLIIKRTIKEAYNDEKAKD